MNKPCASQELFADYLFGGIADKRKLLKSVAVRVAPSLRHFGGRRAG